MGKDGGDPQIAQRGDGRPVPLVPPTIDLGIEARPDGDAMRTRGDALRNIAGAVMLGASVTGALPAFFAFLGVLHRLHLDPMDTAVPLLTAAVTCGMFFCTGLLGRWAIGVLQRKPGSANAFAWASAVTIPV